MIVNAQNEDFFAKKFSKKSFLHHSFIRMIVNAKNEDIFVKKIPKKVFTSFVYPNDENSKNGGNFYVK